MKKVFINKYRGMCDNDVHVNDKSELKRKVLQR